MSEAVIFVVALLGVALVFGIGSFFVRRAIVRVERAALVDLNAPLVETDDRRFNAALRRVEDGFLVCTACGFENFVHFQYCTICGETLAQAPAHGDERQNAYISSKEDTSACSSLLSVFRRDSNLKQKNKSTPLSAPSKDPTRRQLRAKRRKEWSRKLDVEGNVYWSRDVRLAGGDAAFVVKLKRQGDGSATNLASEEKLAAPSDSSETIAIGNVNIRKDWVHKPVARSVEQCMLSLVKETQGLEAELTTASDPSVDASKMPVGTQIEPVLALKEILTLASKDFPTKHAFFVRTASSLLVPAERGHMRLKVDRRSLLEDSMKSLAVIPSQKLRSALRINFVGESGVDAGGLHREWFVILNDMLVDQDRGLFVCANKSEQTYFLSPCSDGDLLPTQLLHLVATGRLLGRAQLEGSMMCFHLAPPLLKLILGYPLSFEDLDDYDPEVYANLRWLLENDNVDSLGLDFTVTVKDGASHRDIELVPGGHEIAVTDSNKREYVERKWQYLLVESVAPQLQAFLQGSYEVIPHDLLLLFDPEEFDFLLCGSDEIDVDDWERNTQYSNELHLHRARKLFWELVREMPNEYRRRLLQFSTGSSRVPLGGFAALTNYDDRLCPFMLKAVPVERGDGCIHSHACFNRLDLPLYFEREKMKTVLYAMLDTEVYGFTMN